MFDIALAAYILALLHVIFYVISGKNNLKIMINLFAVCGLAFNLIAFFQNWKATGFFPTSTVPDLLIFLDIGLVGAYIATYIKYRRPVLGLFMMPLAVCGGLMAKILPSTHAVKPEITSFWLYIHLPFTIIGTGFFIVATVSSLIYFIQERELKKKNFGVIFRRFPPLDVINRVITNTLLTGFYFFTIGVVSGFLWSFYRKSESGFFTSKMIFAVITWIIFGSIAYLKHFKGMSPKDTAITTVVGFISVLLTYIGVAIFLIG